MQSTAERHEEPTAIRTSLGAIFVSLELSRSIWLMTSVSPGGGGKMSKRSVPAGDIAALLTRFSELGKKAFVQTRTNRDHVAAFTARSTFVSVATSVPAPTRTVATPSTISIIPAALPGRTVAAGGRASGIDASTITGVKVTPPSLPRRRATCLRESRRQPNNCCGVNPYRRATAETSSALS
jgi:hypothetical protein